MGNAERNHYVKDAITSALIQLLREKPFPAITVQAITTRAMVSRNSYYRNYPDIRTIVLDHLDAMLGQWEAENPHTPGGNDAALFASLFNHISTHRDLYLLLKAQGLFPLFHEAYLKRYGPTPETDNAMAYAASFIAYGTLGWIEAWMNRGMQETGEEMGRLLSSAAR